jgi:hypothetical protein
MRLGKASVNIGACRAENVSTAQSLSPVSQQNEAPKHEHHLTLARSSPMGCFRERHNGGTLVQPARLRRQQIQTL